MNLLIDGPTEPEHYVNAVTAFMRVRADNPNQGYGNGESIPFDINGIVYDVVRNQDSYAVRIDGGTTMIDETLEGIPV